MNASRRAQSRARHAGAPPGTAFWFRIRVSAAVNCAQVAGLVTPALWSICVFTTMPSGDQSFGKP